MFVCPCAYDRRMQRVFLPSKVDINDKRCVLHLCVCDGEGTLLVCQVQGVRMYPERGSRMRGDAVMSWL